MSSRNHILLLRTVKKPCYMFHSWYFTHHMQRRNYKFLHQVGTKFTHIQGKRNCKKQWMIFRITFLKGDIAQQFHLEVMIWPSNNSVSPSMRQDQKANKVYVLSFALTTHFPFLTLVQNIFLMRAVFLRYFSLSLSSFHIQNHLCSFSTHKK